MATYRVTRRFFDDSIPEQCREEGLTLEEAQKICRDPESSSRTCQDPDNVRMTELFGPWFDGYSEE